jgi:hypothetical protein
MLIFIISFPDLIKFPYFMGIPEKRVWLKGGSKRGWLDKQF